MTFCWVFLPCWKGLELCLLLILAFQPFFVSLFPYLYLYYYLEHHHSGSLFQFLGCYTFVSHKSSTFPQKSLKYFSNIKTKILYCKHRYSFNIYKQQIYQHTHTHTHVGFYGLRGLSIGVMVFILYKLYVLLPYTYPTPKLSPHRRRCISTFPQKTHSVWFISILNYGDTENVLINHLLLVIPMSYPCHYTNVCPHKPHKHAPPPPPPHTHTHTHFMCKNIINMNKIKSY